MTPSSGEHKQRKQCSSVSTLVTVYFAIDAAVFQSYLQNNWALNQHKSERFWSRVSGVRLNIILTEKIYSKRILIDVHVIDSRDKTTLIGSNTRTSVRAKVSLSITMISQNVLHAGVVNFWHPFKQCIYLHIMTFINTRVRFLWSLKHHQSAWQTT